MPDQPTYKEIHGKTRVGMFLEKLGAKAAPIAEAALEVASLALPGLDKVADLIKNSTQLDENEKTIALEMIKLDMVDMQEVTKRWQADMTSDSWLSKNVRPMVLAFMVVFTAAVIIADSVPGGFNIKDVWIDTLGTLNMTAIGAYFGLRSFEKKDFKLPKFRR